MLSASLRAGPALRGARDKGEDDKGKLRAGRRAGTVRHEKRVVLARVERR